jgi:tRNA-binding EMAP/Myf-like protein
VGIILKRLRVQASDKELLKKLKIGDEIFRQRISALVALIKRGNEAARRRRK